MATLREYYEKDFSHSVKVYVKIAIGNESIEGAVLYDFAGFNAFLSLYVSGANRDMDYFIGILSQLKYGDTKLPVGDKVILPSAKTFHGSLKMGKENDLEIFAQFYGDPDWISAKDIQSTKRVFIYSETNLIQSEISLLKERARELGHELQFRGEGFREERSRFEKPLAFISHDSRDKDTIAGVISRRLQAMLCPIWYDEYSLKIGDNLRVSIEKGLRECKKCVLILSPNFLSNNGWTKVEFDSIFTRQILEESKLVLPIWYNVSQKDVFDYCPSLANVFAADWNRLGEDESCKQVYNAITA